MSARTRDPGTERRHPEPCERCGTPTVWPTHRAPQPPAGGEERERLATWLEEFASDPTPVGSLLNVERGNIRRAAQLLRSGGEEDTEQHRLYRGAIKERDEARILADNRQRSGHGLALLIGAAHRTLDDVGAPSADENGARYSLDGRIRLLASRAAGEPVDGLTFATLRRANLARLPHFRTRHGTLAHSEPDGSDWSPAQWLQAVVGELGEYANLRKKLERGDLTAEEFAREAADELADVQGYLDILAYQLGIDLGAATASKWDRISERVGYAGRIGHFRADLPPPGPVELEIPESGVERPGEAWSEGGPAYLERRTLEIAADECERTGLTANAARLRAMLARLQRPAGEGVDRG